MLSEQEKARYARQILLQDIGLEGQEKIKKASVLVVGVGGLGSALTLYMCAAGVGTLGIIDDDKVAESNLQRQVLYTTQDVGRNKVEAAAERLAALNPNVSIRSHCFRLQQSNAAQILQDYDIIVDGCDNLSTRYLINDTCVNLNKVYVYGAIAEFTGQVAVFNYCGGPTYRCLYPSGANLEEKAEPPGVIGALPGVVATIQASEAIKLICGVGASLSGQVLLIDLLANQFDKIVLQRQVPESAVLS
jgi:molybdopterin/thiamine biosynthesis adenylyltransferase